MSKLMFKKTVSRALEGVFASLPEDKQQWMLTHFIYRKKIEEKNLSVVSPPLFDAVFFEVRTRCNGHCKFCLASVESDPREDISMPRELFEKVLQDLVDLQYEGRLAFHNNNEPLLFKELPEFVSRAKERLPQCHIHILTNGRSLTLPKMERLIEAGVDQVSVNVYRTNSDEPIPQVLTKIRTELLERMFSDSELEVLGLGNDQSPKKPKFSFVVSARLENEILDSRAGTAPNKKAPATVARGFCQYPFTQFIVTANGQVAGCCNDLLFELPMGNVRTSSVFEIWMGEEFSQLRKNLLNGERKAVKTCSKCDFIGVKKPPPGLIARLTYIGLRGRT